MGEKRPDGIDPAFGRSTAGRQRQLPESSESNVGHLIQGFHDK